MRTCVFCCCCYFQDEDNRLLKILFHEKIEDIVAVILGPNVFFQHSELIIKSAQNQNCIFPWHQNSGLIPFVTITNKFFLFRNLHH